VAVLRDFVGRASTWGRAAGANAVDENPDRQAEELLNGERLVSITFILDYLQLGFDDAGMSVLVWPMFMFEELSACYGDADYRDMLCELIEQEVERVTIVPDHSMELLFSSGALLSISLLIDDRVGGGGEAVLLSTPDHRLWVW
jgi:hypothetical protein